MKQILLLIQNYFDSLGTSQVNEMSITKNKALGN